MMLRVPQVLSEEVGMLARERGLSKNAMSMILLRYGLQASQDKLTLNERLNLLNPAGR